MSRGRGRYDRRMKRAAAAWLLVLVAVSGCSGTDDGKRSSNPTGSDSPTTTAGCTESSAKAVARAQISKAKIEPACVKVSKGGNFTLLNADAKAHSFTTTPSAPVQLQVDLGKGSAFPFRFKKSGTYTFKEASSDLTLTIIVG